MCCRCSLWKSLGLNGLSWYDSVNFPNLVYIQASKLVGDGSSTIVASSILSIIAAVVETSSIGDGSPCSVTASFILLASFSSATPSMASISISTPSSSSISLLTSSTATFSSAVFSFYTSSATYFSTTGSSEGSLLLWSVATLQLY